MTPEYAWAARPDWERSWDEVVALVGTDVRPDHVDTGADELERGIIRRYLEPLELDCPLHYDAEVARAHGYPDVIAPYSGCATWVSPALWAPGEPAYYTSDARDLLPAFRTTPFPVVGPPTNAKVATDLETEFHKPFVLGDRPYKRGARLLACSPKESSLGRGAFLTWESDIRGRDHSLIAQVRTSLYYYVPRSTYAPESAGDARA